MSPVRKPASNRGGVCGNLVLSKLCSIFQAFLVVLQTLCSESKPADSRLAFLTPSFALFRCSFRQSRGWKPLFGPSVPRHELHRHPEEQHVGKQGKGHGAAPPNLPAFMPNAHGKQNIVLVIPYFCFCSFFPPPSPPVTGCNACRAAAKGHGGGMNCP